MSPSVTKSNVAFWVMVSLLATCNVALAQSTVEEAYPEYLISSERQIQSSRQVGSDYGAILPEPAYGGRYTRQTISQPSLYVPSTSPLPGEYGRLDPEWDGLGESLLDPVHSIR